jgi:hypothetical protein
VRLALLLLLNVSVDGEVILLTVLLNLFVHFDEHFVVEEILVDDSNSYDLLFEGVGARNDGDDFAERSELFADSVDGVNSGLF